jgi:hypothetical protein
MTEERYEECDRCGERYDGEDAIRSYLRDVEIGEGPSREVETVCIGCLSACTDCGARPRMSGAQLCSSCSERRLTQ